MNDKSLKYLHQLDINQFQYDLVSWFSREKRLLPWRETQEPYKIWVSEVMLQQTRVDTVIPYYVRFLEKFPTIADFARADEESILKIWEGLGYYSRVRNLHIAMKDVVDRFHGIVPDTYEEISSLKGVGPYTAGAILSIAFGKPEPAVDGNVMRVLSRILLIEADIAKPATRKIFEQAVRQLIDPNHASYFNQGLMELGALICTPTSPSCLLCPVRDHCQAFHQGVTEQLPVKSKKKSQKQVELAVAVLKTKDGRYLIRKRPEKGLLANLWEFPTVEVAETAIHSKRKMLGDYLQKELQINCRLEGSPYYELEHPFTHLKWVMQAYKGTAELTDTDDAYRFVTGDELEALPFPVSYQKIWEHAKD